MIASDPRGRSNQRRCNCARDAIFFLLPAKASAWPRFLRQRSASLLRNVEAATKNVAHLTPEEAATDEDYWATIQNSFSVTRGIINLNNGGVSPSPRIVTEALVRYIWEQEDATAYTMWQILEPQSETIRTGPGRAVRLRSRRNRDHAQRFGVARDSAHGHGLQTRRRNSHHHSGLPAHAHHVASA